MATKKSAQYPYQWPDGTWHSIPATQHQQNVKIGKRQPWTPPPGSYDPNLDVQERTARTGYQENIEDIGKGSERETTDYGLGLTDIGRQRQEYQQDYSSNLSDILTARAHGQEDYQTNLQTLGRNYQRLGNTQAQRGRQMGLYGGGAAAQGAQKRAANQGIEKTALDTGLSRFMEGSQTAQQRLDQQRERALGTGGAFERATGQLELGHGRAQEDYATQERRQGSTLSDYIQDIAGARQAQYKQPTGLPTKTSKKTTKKGKR